ncbi:nucleotidyltransferase family protein [Fulvivirga sp.]|uniref:nucleotidyltransferase family protein n=1 Tax=Fulvivirga sp. TaxID=1931237 RepID=UPI0032F03D98
MRDFKDHLIKRGLGIKSALAKLNILAGDAILFVVDEQNKLLGSLTDGDVRRGLLKNLDMENKVEEFIQPEPKHIKKGNYSLDYVIKLKSQNFKIIPVVNDRNEVVNVINFRFLKSYLPFDAVIMAGGRGSRLRPLTDKMPKPLLKVGDKSIIEHNIDHLISFGIDDFWISLNYLGDQIENALGNGSDKGVEINYVWESEPLGTIGAVSKIKKFHHDYVLIINSDVLTTLDYEDFFLDFLEKEADMSVATIPYSVNIPYAVFETWNHHVVSFKEKPNYTYYSNGGIYLIKKELLKRIPKDTFFNSTDLMEDLIAKGNKLISFPMRQYWLDIGRMEDFNKAQEDIKHLNF